MIIEILLSNGRKATVTLPDGAAVSSDQLRVLVKWAQNGKPAALMLE
jgi:hypothetical protein